jgi:hypothetical protein
MTLGPDSKGHGQNLLFIGDFTAKMPTFKHAPHRHNTIDHIERLTPNQIDYEERRYVITTNIPCLNME